MEKECRILYTAPRYHTNQVPIMHGWHNQGCKVMFMATFVGISEVHDDVEFHLLKKSWISKLLFKHIDKKYDANRVEWKKVCSFIPAIRDTARKIKAFQPDIVIMRERVLPNAVIYFICRMLGIKNVIQYVQTPIADGVFNDNAIKRRIQKLLFPKVVFSPIDYNGKNRQQRIVDNVYFVPLISESTDVYKKAYFKNQKINFLLVGKYRDVKNHFFLVDVFERLRHRLDLSGVKLTMMGEVANDSENEYYQKLEAYIHEKKLEDVVELQGSLPFEQMSEYYLDFDVLLLPSTSESAGMVILEAMEKGLCVASSIYCGLSCYLEKYQCGYTYDIRQPEELTDLLTKLIHNPNKIEEMGRKSCQVIREHLLFKNYEKALNELTEKEFGYTFY